MAQIVGLEGVLALVVACSGASFGAIDPAIKASLRRVGGARSRNGAPAIRCGSAIVFKSRAQRPWLWSARVRLTPDPGDDMDDRLLPTGWAVKAAQRCAFECVRLWRRLAKEERG